MIRLYAMLSVLVVAAPASAQDDPDEFPGGELFYSADTIGLVYAPLAIVAAVELGLEPPETPRLFSPDEGGAPSFDNTVPEIYVGLAGAAIAAGIFIPEREGRWYHVKGMSQAVSLTLALTSIGKNVFGRHRPHWSPETSSIEDTRRSFPSGHSSTGFSIATYGCLFLHREGAGIVEGIACASLLAAAGLTAYSRVRDNRHHWSDVIAGASLGVVVSSSMFAISELRYRDAVDEATPLALRVGEQF